MEQYEMLAKALDMLEHPQHRRAANMHTTPRPWSYQRSSVNDNRYMILGQSGGALCVDLGEANASLIVRAVNSYDTAHDALVLAGQVLDSMLNGQGLEADNIDAALQAVHTALRAMNGKDGAR